MELRRNGRLPFRQTKCCCFAIFSKQSVHGEYGKTTRCYAASQYYRGGARIADRDAGKHLTAGITVATDVDALGDSSSRPWVG